MKILKQIPKFMLMIVFLLGNQGAFATFDFDELIDAVGRGESKKPHSMKQVKRVLEENKGFYNEVAIKRIPELEIDSISSKSTFSSTKEKKNIFGVSQIKAPLGDSMNRNKGGFCGYARFHEGKVDLLQGATIPQTDDDISRNAAYSPGNCTPAAPYPYLAHIAYECKEGSSVVKITQRKSPDRRFEDMILREFIKFAKKHFGKLGVEKIHVNPMVEKDSMLDFLHLQDLGFKAVRPSCYQSYHDGSDSPISSLVMEMKINKSKRKSEKPKVSKKSSQ